MEARFNIAIVQTIFHKAEIDIMLRAARQQASEIALDVVKVCSVPGSMELPLVMDRVLAQPDIDGAVALGIIEKGETAHGRVMADAVISNLIAVQLQRSKPVGVGILGPEIMPSQIPSRLEGYATAAVRAVKTVLELLDNSK
jgi:6,7-dimethyl-8-ribityllumazine synthase